MKMKKTKKDYVAERLAILRGEKDVKGKKKPIRKKIQSKESKEEVSHEEHNAAKSD
jgi:hypothetical protein